MTLKNIKKSMNTLSNLIDFMPSSESDQQILNERAKHLSKQIIDKSTETLTCHYVRFNLGEQEFYGIPYHYIKEVMLHVSPTKVPHAPYFIAGVINRQGLLLSVLDLKSFFHLQSTDSPKNSHLIIISVKGVSMAILTDNILGSDAYDPLTLDAPLTSEEAIKAKYIIGLHRGITAIINLETLMSDPKLNMIQIKE